MRCPIWVNGIAYLPAFEVAKMEAERDALAAELTLLSDKACAAVVHYRAALMRLTDSFKYSTEVVTIAREALAQSEVK